MVEINMAGFSFFPIMIVLITALLMIGFILTITSRKYKKATKVLFCTLIGFVIFILFVVLGNMFYTPEVDLGDGFKYHEDYCCIFSPGDAADIVPKILWYKTDEKYITAKQHPQKHQEYLYNYNENYSYANGLNDDYYWLVLKVERKVFGPLTYDEFILLCKEHAVHENLIVEKSK